MNVSVGEGPWAVQMSVDPKNVDRALGKAVEQIKSLQTQPVSDDEFLDAKYSLMGGLPVYLENNENISKELVNIEYYKLGDDYFKKYYEAYNGITRRDIQDTAKTYLYPDKMFVIISGPVKE
jgi:zinc protease